MIEEIKRTFYPEDDEDIHLIHEFVKTMNGYHSSKIVGLNEYIEAIFRVKII